MAKTFFNVEGFEHLKGPSAIAAVTKALSAFVIALAIFDLKRPGTFTVLSLLSSAITFVSYIALLVFFLLLYRHLVGRPNVTNIRATALLAAIAIILSILLDTYFRLRLRWNSEDLLFWLFRFGLVPQVILALFFGIVAMNASRLTNAPIRRISGLLIIFLGLQAILRAWSLVAELSKVGFRTEWSWASWWAFLVQPSVGLLGSIVLTFFFLGIWKSDARVIRDLCSTPVSVQRWIVNRFGSADKRWKVLFIAQVAGAASVLAGSVTYVEPYNEIWPLLGRILLLPGSAVAIFVSPNRFNRLDGLLTNLVYTALAVALNVAALRLWKAFRHRRSRSTEEHSS